ncbi:MAG: FG-GAP-like repeat-containing protein [Actinomycetota bacterium]|nr:FG-GAP-like repeat-containing protein [Actinomycetota bacterium]
MTGGAIRAVLAAAALAVLATAPALATSHDWPGSNPDESVRVNTPNDPNFDGCETDDEDGQHCANVFEQEIARFGFAPGATQHTATYKNPTDPHVQRLMAQNTLAGRNPLGQVAGVSADRAWKRTPGDPSVRIAIIDTGIEWDARELRLRVALNRGELPDPRKADASQCGADDCNGDGAFNVDDFANDARVAKTSGHDSADSMLDGSDLIAAFSDGTDDDGNGFADDIAGWDFFDDDNDPFDASSYSAGEGHGTGQAEGAAREGNDGSGDLGVCPRCQIVPLRDWDSFVPDTNYFAEAVTYAADNGIEVVEGAIGGIYNTRYAQAAFDYAYRRGTFLAIVSSDINSANHNMPTFYDESLYVSGTVADAEGLGTEGYPEEMIQFFGQFGINLVSNFPVGTYFRNSGLTQYGGHAHIMFPAVTGSIATGQAAGAAGLIHAMARKKSLSPALQPNEIKQLLTMTAEDVVPENTVGTGVPDPAQRGWDQHFGYGRADLALALERIDQGKIPPQVLIDSPDWFMPLNVERTPAVSIGARISAERASGYDWELQWAPGIEPCEVDFRKVAGGSGAAPRSGSLAAIDLSSVRAALDARTSTTAAPECNPPQPATGGSTPDPTAPGKGPGDRDPNEPAFTVRVVVTDSAGNRGEDRKVLFAYRDTTARPGWSKYIGTGGEASPRMYDLDGDNRLETIVADSSGELSVYRADGTPLPSFNGGAPVRTRTYANAHTTPAHGAIGRPLEVLRTPAIGDVDGDGEADIVVSAGEHVYGWRADGSELQGFPVRLDPAHSEPGVRTKRNHVKRGFIASPTLTDLDGDGRLDIAIAGMDQRLYAWDGEGDSLPGFPLRLKKPGETDAQVAGAESINTAAAGDLTGDKKPELVVATNEVEGVTSGPEVPGAPSLGGANGRVYAVGGDGKILPGWPIEPNALLPDVLPFVGPGVDHALGDVTGDGKLDVIGNIATGTLTARDQSGATIHEFTPTPPGGEHQDRSLIANAFDNPIVADVDSVSPGPEVAKAGLTLQGAANLLLVGQNLPFNHVLQAWNGENGDSLPAYPQNTEDFVLLSSPAAADVSDAPGNELVVGTGLYLLRSMNAQGLEGAGWPKFTGGWIMTVPAFGDADGDGKLEVTTLTREGHAFLWDTDRPACGTNDEWWTSHHDEFSTSAYGTDSRPPGTPGALSATRREGRIVLSWVAPGDDWLCGDSKRFRVLGSNGGLDAPRQGTRVAEGDAVTLGKAQSLTVDDARGRARLAVLHMDEAGNPGHLASVAVPQREGETTFSEQGGDFGVPGIGPGAGPEGLSPLAGIDAPTYASDTSRSTRFKVRWSATGPAGIGAYDLEVRRGAGRWRRLLAGTLKRSTYVRGRQGETYSFRVRARGRDGRRSSYATDTTVIPLDDRSSRLRRSRAWRRSGDRTAYGRGVATGPRHATLRMRYRGARVALIAPRSPDGGRLAVQVDRRRKVIHLRGDRAARQVVFTSRKLSRRRVHTLRVKVLSRGAARLDAVAVRR